MMKMYENDKHKPAIPRVLLKPEEAAESLGICRSTLDKNLHPNGMCIPHFRSGSRVCFSVRALDDWAYDRAMKQ